MKDKVRKRVKFAEKVCQIRLFLLDDAPNASEPRKEECMSLKEAFGVANMPGFYLGIVNQNTGAVSSF